MAKYLAGDILTAALLEDDVDDWDTYTPAWTASVNPAIGNGTITGQYKRIGNFVVVDAGFVAGTTTTFGTSQWFFSLPVNAAQPGNPLNDPYIGDWHGWDNSVTQHRKGQVILASATTMSFHTHADPAAGVTSAAPITWATSDRLTARAVYRAA